MKVKMSIRNQMLINILTTSVIIFSFSIGYMSFKTRGLVIDDAKKLALSVTMDNALKIEKKLSEDLVMLQTLSDVYAYTNTMDDEEWKPLYARMAMDIFERRDNLIGFSASWEESFYNKEEPGQKNRYFYHLARKDGSIIEQKEIRDLNSKLYQRAKKINKSVILDPRNSTSKGQQSIKVNLLTPIKKGNTFAGYVVGDFATQDFHEIVTKIKPYDLTIGYLVSNSGLLVSHPNTDFIGDTLMKYAPYFEEQFNLSDIIREGRATVNKGVDEFGNSILLVTAPIQVGEVKAPWALTLVIPVKSILYEANKTQTMSLIVAILGMLLIAAIIYWRASNIGSAIKNTTGVLEKLAKGNIEGIQNIKLDRGDEIDVMADSVNSLKTSLNETSVFAEQIGIGNLDAEFEPLGENDKLGNSLLNMQKNLVKAKADEEKMKFEEEKNKWTSDGLARFGDIIRSNNDDIEKLSYNIVKNLVDYLNASMGALFVSEIEDDETVYSVKAAVAYDRQKLINGNIKIGQGLVGRCVFEKLSINISDIPDDYVSIKSGIGGANPRELLLVPLVFEEKVLGVVELASFNAFEDYMIAFVEKLAENIASTLASTKTNLRTMELLEQSKMQGEELAAQEEEMRQNVEELQATQEEAARREQEMIDIIEMIDNAVFKVEYDVNGNILALNEKYAAFLDANAGMLVNKKVKDEYLLLGILDTKIEDDWMNIVSGDMQTRKLNVEINSESCIIEEHYSAIRLSGKSHISKIIKVSYIVS